MAGAGLLAGAVALVAAGAALGALFTGGTGQAPASRGTPTPTAGDATSGTRSPGPPPGLPPPLPSGTSTTPKLAMGQYYGDGDTVFVVHGSGFVPGPRSRCA